MSITKLQQYQMSGSLAADISDSIVRSDLVKENRTIADDLNSLRTQVKGILGEGAWTDEQAVSLSQVYAAMHVDGANAEVQGNLSVIGESTLASAIVSDLTQSRVVFAGVDGALVDDAALSFDASGNALSVGAYDKNGNFYIKNSNNLSTIEIGTYAGASTQLNLRDDSNNLAINNYVDAGSTSIGLSQGTMRHVYIYADNSGGVIGLNDASGPDTIILSGVDGSIMAEGAVDFNSTLDVAGQVDLAAAGVATSVRGTLNVSEEATLASAIVSDLTETRVVFAGTSGALVDDAALSFASNTLAVGASGAAGTVSVHNASNAETIKLDGAAATATLGGPVNGQVSLKSAANLERITLTAAESGFNGIAITDKDAYQSKLAGQFLVFSDTSVPVDQFIYRNDGWAGFDGTGMRAVSLEHAAFQYELKFWNNDGKISGLDTTKIINATDAASKAYVDSYVNTANLYLDGANGNATFAGNIQVDGDLRVKGSMTYIDTQHVRVEDAFIYLATGSLGTTDSGIVLHGGAGAGMDLAIAQKGGEGEFIFGKGDRQPDGEGSLVGMELVPAKFAGIKLGSAEDALSGSVSISGDNIKVAASAAALVLDDAYRAGSSYSGDFKLASSAAEWTAFQNQYPGKSLLGALGAGGGVGVNFRKKVLMGDNANFSGNTLDIAAAGIGTLRSTAQADADYGLDVYLNGVLLALGAQADYTVPSTSEISFNYAINSDDVLTVIAKNVA